MGALFSIHSAQHPVFLDFLSYIGYSDIESTTISRFFVDLQDNDDYNIIGEPENIEALYGVPNPNRRLQLEQELDIYLQVWPKLYEYKNLFHTYSIYIMNMLQTPAPILYGSLGPDIGQDILNSRYNDDFSTFTLKRLMESKYGPEVTSTSSSGIYRISVTWESDELLWEQANDVILRRMSRPPFIIINRIH